ncbi:hypothetical protein EIN_044100 [Entamoeba invadens IP1]|uniref:Uncharacterized protein n=1 Tax=Entamoeba invadens IP1 TaxID=370355 RepID=A0A0A1TZ65_ENTIV|nr:hypothetical protein EIN_044100 [Entamoeba invadens IP1]ELP86862.1 hypothetical protein EIN_044100 [Entamoeba invadens IP1]|eukprot:XP_004253633.1 hypothetical protein EIN_044100 [Entamoeba invadens IP1]
MAVTNAGNPLKDVITSDFKLDARYLQFRDLVGVVDKLVKSKVETFPKELKERRDIIYTELEKIQEENLHRKEITKEAIGLAEDCRKMAKLVKNVFLWCEVEGNTLMQKNNSLIKDLLVVEDKIAANQIAQNPEDKAKVMRELEMKKSGLRGRLIEKKSKDAEKSKDHRNTENNNSKHQKLNGLSKEEVTQLEDWTQMRIGQVVFDGEHENWSTGTSVFDAKIYHKRNLVFVIEDANGNKFGGFVKSEIDTIGGGIVDTGSFLFSLASNGRFDCMQKFPISQEGASRAFWVWPANNWCLLQFGFCGDDISIAKKSEVLGSSCTQSAYIYPEPLSLCGNSNFDTTNITVYQMM